MLQISTGKLFFKGIYIHGHTKTLCKQNGPSYKEKELHLTATSNTFQRKYENFD